MKTFRLFLLALILFPTGCIKSDDEPNREYVLPGDPLPAFTEVGEDGASYHSADAPGKLTLICFFNTTCPDCHRELPKLQYVWEELSPEEGFGTVCIGRARTLA